jgi:hypothetical protein
MACVSTFATLRIFSRAHSVAELSEFLGVQPTGGRDKNPAARRPSERDFTVWKLSSKEESLGIVDEQQHIDFLLAKFALLAGKLEMLRRQECSIDVCCYYEIDGQGGPTLTCAQMKALSELGLDVTWDLYCADDVS